MTGHRVKGGLSRAQGPIQEGAGERPGNRALGVKGKVRQAQGKLKGAMGKVEDTVPRVHGR